MYEDQLTAYRRAAIWEKLTDIADQLHELHCRWWQEDSELVDTYYEIRQAGEDVLTAPSASPMVDDDENNIF